jgi:hypothetical protein
VSPALLKRMTPEMSIISAGIKDLPGVFDAFNYGHPRDCAVDLLELGSTGTRTLKSVVTMMAQEKKNPARTMGKAVYCTCWDGDIVVSSNATGSTLTVTTSAP